MSSSLDDGLRAEAQAALHEWSLGAPLLPPCIAWRAALARLLQSQEQLVPGSESCSVHRKDEPVQLVLHDKGITAYIADYSKVHFQFSGANGSCGDMVTWKRLDQTNPETILKWTDVLGDQDKWPDKWHKLRGRCSISEVFVSTEHPQGLLVVRIPELAVARHYRWMRTIHSIDFHPQGQLGGRFISTGHHTLDVDVSSAVLDHRARIHGAIYPDEILDVPLDHPMNRHFQALINFHTR